MCQLSNLQIQEKIYSAFCLAVPPEKPEAYVTNPSYESVEETEKFWDLKWEDLSLDMFDKHNRVFSFFPEGNFLYFAGALMWLSLKSDSVEVAGDIVTSWLERPIHKGRTLPSRFEKHLHQLSEFQVCALRNYLNWFCSQSIPFHRDIVKKFCEFTDLK